MADIQYTIVGHIGATLLHGESAYEIAVKYGYTGTEAEFANMFNSIQTLHDEAEAASTNTVNIYNSISAWGLSVEDGKLCVTYTEEE